VVCYGPLADTAMLNTVAAPVLGVYGVNDGRVNNQLPGIVSRMQSLGKSFVADSYPGTGHGFLKPGRNGYGTPAAQQAWADIDAFFTRHLEGQ
jgi:dienelactone hydrolase